MKNLLLFAVTFLIFLSFNSCRKKKKDNWDDTIQSGIINIAADKSFENLINAEIKVYESVNNFSAIIFPIYTNENEVIRLLTEDSVRLAVATRDLNTIELKKLEEKKMIHKKFLIAFEGIALIINITNQDSIMSLQTLKKILTGEITEWSKVNPKSSLGPIRIIFDNNQSSLIRFVNDSIARNESLSPNLYALKNIDELIEKVSELPNAIGIVGFSQISEEYQWKSSSLQTKIRLMRIGKDENATLQNTYLPYLGDIITEEYPLWRPVYVLLTDPRMGLSSAFSIFLARDAGQTVIQKSGFLPAVRPPSVRDVEIKDKML